MAVPKEKLDLWRHWELTDDMTGHIEGLITQWMHDFNQTDDSEYVSYQSRTLALVGQAYKLLGLWEQFRDGVTILEEMAEDADDDDDNQIGATPCQ